MAEVYLPFRSGTHRWLLRYARWNPDLDGLRVHDDGRVVVTMGRRIMTAGVDNITAMEAVELRSAIRSMGVRRGPFSADLIMATDLGPAQRLVFLEPVRPALGPRRHSSVTVTLEDPHDLLPAIVAVQRDLGL
ncbi:MAG: hypothetical protein GY745_15945 [Actinomycetia bacterium]|nr:hypothetical protein [Actinomycetes bacterium]MCP3912750.1 hypothetical protein [Actinomycetes bacterium]MCP4086526.1 hypothetical protein [Actinomycetes bacterium]